MASVIWTLAAIAVLGGAPFVVRWLRRDRWQEPPPRWTHTSPFAEERADAELADRLRREVDEMVDRRRRP